MGLLHFNCEISESEGNGSKYPNSYRSDPGEGPYTGLCRRTRGLCVCLVDHRGLELGFELIHNSLSRQWLKVQGRHSLVLAIWSHKFDISLSVSLAFNQFFFRLTSPDIKTCRLRNLPVTLS